MSLIDLDNWKTIMKVILTYCRFKDILMLNCSTKKLILLCQTEIKRRMKIYSSCPQGFESIGSYFYAAKCDGAVLKSLYYEKDGVIYHNEQPIKLECGKYCYVSEIKDGFCKVCNKKREERALLEIAYIGQENTEYPTYVERARMKNMTSRLTKQEKQLV